MYLAATSTSITNAFLCLHHSTYPEQIMRVSSPIITQEPKVTESSSLVHKFPVGRVTNDSILRPDHSLAVCDVKSVVVTAPSTAQYPLDRIDHQ